MAPGIREDARRYPTQGAFHHRDVRDANGARCPPAEALGPDPAPFSPSSRCAGRTPALLAMARQPDRRDGEPSTVDPSQRPRVTSAFEWRSAARYAAELPLPNMPPFTPVRQQKTHHDDKKVLHNFINMDTCIAFCVWSK